MIRWAINARAKTIRSHFVCRMKNAKGTLCSSPSSRLRPDDFSGYAERKLLLATIDRKSLILDRDKLHRAVT